MKIKTKLIVLMIAMAGIFGLAIGAQYIIERRRAIEIFDAEKKSMSLMFDEVLRLEQSPLRLFAFDYTYWDEMVKFILSGDQEWAKTNIDASLVTFKADYVWVYDADFKPAYHANVLGKTPVAMPIPPEWAKETLSGQKRLCHFFVRADNGLIEVQGATIHPGWDEKRTSPVKGYFFVARVLGEEYISKLEEYLGDMKVGVSYVPQLASNMSDDLSKGIIKFSRAVKDWRGEVAAYFLLEATSSSLASFNKASTQMFLLLVIFVVLGLGAFFVFVTFWVNRPLNMISQSLEKDAPEDIVPLLKSWDEFGRMAQLMDNFFRQRKTLVAEIDRRRKMEEELSAKLSQLKQFKDIAVGREIKMIELKKEVNKLSKELGKPEPYDASF